MKSITETRDKRNFERVRALFVTYTRVTKNMYSISAIQSRVLFFIYIVNNVIISISLRLLVLDWKKILLKIQESYITLY